MKKIFISVLAAILLVGCGGPDISPDRPRTGNIVVLGDSLTEGYGVNESARYTTHLLAKLRLMGYENYRLINLGVSGDTTADGLARVHQVFQFEPEIVIVALGGNDFLRGTDTTIVEQNLREIIAGLTPTKADVLLVGVAAPPTRGLGYTSQARRMYKGLANSLELPLMPNILKGLLLDQRYMQSDNIHPNPTGHLKISDNMWRYLKPMLRR